MPETILCAVADDDRLQDVVATGRALAGGAGLRVLFAHVAEPAVAWPGHTGHAAGIGAPELPPDPLSASYAELAEHARENGRRLLLGAGLAADESIVVSGEPIRELNRLALEHDALLVVIGTHRRGPLSSAVLGSTSRALARRGVRPVLIARSTSLPTTGGAVVCGVDHHDERAGGTVRRAAELATALQRPLVLVHVLCGERLAATAGPIVTPMAIAPTARERKEAERALEELARSVPIDDVESVAVEGRSIAARLDEFATGRRADLLVVGCRGTSGLRAALDGSTSLHLLRQGQRPLVIVPPADSQPES